MNLLFFRSICLYMKSFKVLILISILLDLFQDQYNDNYNYIELIANKYYYLF